MPLIDAFNAIYLLNCNAMQLQVCKLWPQCAQFVFIPQ